MVYTYVPLFKIQQNVGKYTIPMYSDMILWVCQNVTEIFWTPKLAQITAKGMEITKSAHHSLGESGNQPNSGGEEEDFPLETGE